MRQWILFDDPASRRLRPLTWVRPAADLLLGCHTTLERWRLLLGQERLEMACRPSLAALSQDRQPWTSLAIADATGSIQRKEEDTERGAAPEEGAVWVSDLVLPEEPVLQQLLELEPDSVALCSGHLAAFRTGPRANRILRDAVATTGTAAASAVLEQSLMKIAGELPAVEIRATRLSGLADLIRLQEVLIRSDLARILRRTPGQNLHGDAYCYAPDQIRVGQGCRLDHGAVLDAREGPIVLGEDCQVSPHTWIQGPFFAARGNRLVGGRIGGGSSIGPRCRIHGEVEATVILGFSNKAHDGFVGHSYLGEWVNLGALTTTSDLKNNYSLVTLTPRGVPEPTGLRKVGVFLGDHVKTRIGCLLTCGTIVGLGASLIGDPAVGGKWVPEFSWGESGQEYDINKFLETAETVFGRRQETWSPAMAALLREVHSATRA